MTSKADAPVDCFLINSCANDNIHKEFRKAIGANCIFYGAQTHELIVLVSILKANYSPHEEASDPGYTSVDMRNRTNDPQ